MAITFHKSKTPAKASSSMADVLSAAQKAHGDGIGNFGGRLPPASRIPTGLFPLDLALAGGFPRGKVTMIYGPESSNKTNIALRAIAQHQMLWPDKVCALVDIEHAFDPTWAQALGVDTGKLIVVKPSYAEQAVDMVEGFLLSDDCGLVVLDSLAMLLTASELDSSAERANVGGAGVVIGKLARKVTAAMVEAEKREKYPTLILINQITYKIGVVYGDPETTPGGKKPWFLASLVLRCYGKSKTDPKVSQAMPVAKEVNFIVRKFRCEILASTGRFEMATLEHGLFKVGQCDDFNTVSEYLKAQGQFEKDAKKGWVICGDHYDTIQPFKERLYAEPVFGNAVRQGIIDRSAKGSKLIIQDETPPEELADDGD